MLEYLKTHPVIAAVRDMVSVKNAAASSIDTAFILGGDILHVQDECQALRSAGKHVFIHIDLLEGLGKDAAGVDWCVRRVQPDGLISTKSALLRHAREAGLVTVQRVFAMDSQSLKNGLRLLRSDPPDFVEVLPGLLPRAIRMLTEGSGLPVIAGGLITEIEDIKQVLSAGAVAVSTSQKELWNACVL